MPLSLSHAGTGACFSPLPLSPVLAPPPLWLSTSSHLSATVSSLHLPLSTQTFINFLPPLKLLLLKLLIFFPHPILFWQFTRPSIDQGLSVPHSSSVCAEFTIPQVLQLSRPISDWRYRQQRWCWRRAMRWSSVTKRYCCPLRTYPSSGCIPLRMPSATIAFDTGAPTSTALSVLSTVVWCASQ